MKENPFRILLIAVCCALLFFAPTVALAVTETQAGGPPPVEQPLVREGDFAVRLLAALGLGAIDDEPAAESRLSDLGIEPRSGWIADYPVTPAVAGDLRDSVAAAADAGRLSMGRDQALRAFDAVLADAGLPLAPYSGAASYESLPPEADGYLDSAVVSGYYHGSGPPVVTYYEPPPAYYYLYAWVPYPFQCSGFLFPGFYVLHDFHRTVFVNHKRFTVTNHFRDWSTHRVFRLDPLKRFRGDSFSIKRGSDSRAFISFSDRSRYDRRKDRHWDRALPGGSGYHYRPRAGSVVGLPTSGSGRPDRSSFEPTRSGDGGSVGVRSYKAPSFESRGGMRQRFEGVRNGAAPSVGSRSSGRTSFESRRGERQRFEGARSGFAPSVGVRSIRPHAFESGGGGRQRFEGVRGGAAPSVGARSFSRPSFGSGGDRQTFRGGVTQGSGSTGTRSFGRPSWGGGANSIRSGGGGSFGGFSRGGGFHRGGFGRR